MQTENDTSKPKNSPQQRTGEGCPGASCSSFFGDVPLKIAMIGWTPKHRSKVGIPGKIIIIPKTNDGRDWFRHFGVTDSTGACWVQWREMTAKERLLKLYIEAWHIIARDGVSPEDVHAAFMVIPEYRDSLSGETFFSWTNAHVDAKIPAPTKPESITD